jgi:glycosyltransferase involved in cell wall biosynthesis
MEASPTHIVLMPSYNAGPRLREVVADVAAHWNPVIAVIDGSNDGSERPLLELARDNPALTVVVLERNQGKGGAVIEGMRAAAKRGYTHALVMDADGQHPSGSIAEFMEESLLHPEAMVLGRPILPVNTPFERRHGRKLSTGIVRVELLGRAVDDPLFGFRVYPIGPLLGVLQDRRSGRRYDFDTEAAVRLAWAGVPPRNLPAPVRYFTPEEGGVSHFRYIRDNVLLVTMHLKLVAEMMLLRWPALLRHRRRWRVSGMIAALLICACPAARGAPAEALAATGPAIAPASAEWKELSDAFRANPGATANFTERRFFPFKRDPVVLKGEARVSATRGLSLHYMAPEQRTVILDSRGMLVRTAAGDNVPPADPRADGANRALLNILSMDLAALAGDFEPHGQRTGSAWTIALLPRAESLRRAVSRIAASGEGATIRRIEIDRGDRPAVEITIEAPLPRSGFTEEELKQWFR